MAPKRATPSTDSAASPKSPKSPKSPASPASALRRSPRLANVTPSPPTDVPEQPKKKKAKTTTKMEGPSDVSNKTIVIEHCKQCNSFKTRAAQVKEGLLKNVKGVKVLVNPEKPRKGCFEVREEGGEIFISLLEMKRPFKQLKDLDMEQVISDIVNKIK